MNPKEYEADVIKTLVMETFEMTSDEAYSYILENDGFRHPAKVLRKVKIHLGLDQQVSVH